ncbi:hypothetical protein HG536_0H05000 [Torulaspora globosa]|uniref:glutathione transferase n=1 Tax=Torulaspora globosa TaxID=48254 RepID=A0A7G3ZNN7_9SACH|nr:uncharacterized protein HG536_0H05000 [Torulaspora globosa]QLL35123.1 hypothetical protein HG536_0H05000 [Torulaspora globosa]
MALPLIRVHWLNDSRAFRVLFLLEQLKLDYEIVSYRRDEDFRAPAELKKVHPLGRAPLIELEDRSTGKKKVLAESGYIFQYILSHFDTDGVLKNNDPDMAEKIQYYLYYAEGSLQPPLTMERLLLMAKKAPVPFPISYLVGMVIGQISSKYSAGRLKNQIDYVEAEIAKNQGFLVGGKLSGADILISYPLMSVFDVGIAHKKDYPNISKLLDTLSNSGFLCHCKGKG